MSGNSLPDGVGSPRTPDRAGNARELSVDRLPSPSTLRDAVDYLAGTCKTEGLPPSIPPDAGQNRHSPTGPRSI